MKTFEPPQEPDEHAKWASWSPKPKKKKQEYGLNSITSAIVIATSAVHILGYAAI